MAIAFIGIGNVGFALADNLEKVGHEVWVADYPNNKKSSKQAKEKNPSLRFAAPQEAIDKAPLVFLTVPFSAVEEVLSPLDLSGKILVDCTNPIGPGLIHRMPHNASGGEYVQQLVQDAWVVKAFSIYGFENFQNSAYPAYSDTKPAMLLAGEQAEAKHIVGEICRDLGWNPIDTGGINNSLHLEHLALLWIKMGRIQGKGANFVWAILER